MGKKDPRVDAYIAKAGDFAKPILTRLREAVHAACPDVEEAMKWSCPHFICGPLRPRAVAEVEARVRATRSSSSTTATWSSSTPAAAVHGQRASRTYNSDIGTPTPQLHRNSGTETPALELRHWNSDTG